MAKHTDQIPDSNKWIPLKDALAKDGCLLHPRTLRRIRKQKGESSFGLANCKLIFKQVRANRSLGEPLLYILKESWNTLKALINGPVWTGKCQDENGNWLLDATRAHARFKFELRSLKVWAADGSKCPLGKRLVPQQIVALMRCGRGSGKRLRMITVYPLTTLQQIADLDISADAQISLRELARTSGKPFEALRHALRQQLKNGKIGPSETTLRIAPIVGTYRRGEKKGESYTKFGKKRVVNKEAVTKILESGYADRFTPSEANWVSSRKAVEDYGQNQPALENWAEPMPTPPGDIPEAQPKQDPSTKCSLGHRVRWAGSSMALAGR